MDAQVEDQDRSKNVPASAKRRFNRWHRRNDRPPPVDTDNIDDSAGKNDHHLKSPAKSPGVFGGARSTGVEIDNLSKHPASPAKSAAHLMEFVNAHESSSFMRYIPTICIKN